MSDLLTDIKKQSFDIVLFDLVPGVNEETQEILDQSDEIFLLTTPEACSIEKTYRWIESYIMKMGLAPAESQALGEFNQNRKKERHAPLESLFMVREFLASLQLKKTSNRKPFGPIKLIVNQTRSFEDERLGDLIKSVCNKFYFTEVTMAGWLQFDNAVWQCSRQRVPLLVNQPFNPLAGQIQGLVKHLVDHTSERTVV
jgi:MinD-like ATPase involved in chromosome partitioning or flagellar assembly